MLTPAKKACLKSKSVHDLLKAYGSDKFLGEGIGAAGAISVFSSKSHSFYPYADGHVIPEDPLSRGVKVPSVFGFSMCTTIVLSQKKLKLTK